LKWLLLSYRHNTGTVGSYLLNEFSAGIRIV